MNDRALINVAAENNRHLNIMILEALPLEFTTVLTNIFNPKIPELGLYERLYLPIE